MARQSYPDGLAVRNADRGWNVQLTPRGIKASLSHGFDETLARSVPFIPRIIESGIYLDFIQKKPGLMSHIFANRIWLDGREYVVGFVLREDTNGNRFYDHELTQVLSPDRLAPRPKREATTEQWTDQKHDAAETPELLTNQGAVMNMLRDRLGVNDGTGRILFQDETDAAPESGRRPAVVIRGDELGVPEGAGLKEDVAAAKKYYDALKFESEHGRPVKQPQLDKPVRFSGKGWKKNTYGGANIDKWKLFSGLREIIENSTLFQSQELSKDRKDAFFRFHWAETEVVLDGMPRRVGLTLAEDADGNLFYNLNADVDAWAQKSDFSNLPGDSKPGESKSLDQSANAPARNSMTASGDGVNLYIPPQRETPAAPSGPAPRAYPFEKERTYGKNNPDSLQTDRFPEGSVVHADRANRGSVMTILRESCGVNQRPG